MTEKEQIEHLRDEIFKLSIAVKGISGIASANAVWAKDTSQKEGFKKIESELDKAVEKIKMRP